MNVLAAAYVLDWCVGDPSALLHPVRMMGAAIVRGEAMVRRRSPATPSGERIGGALLTVAIVGGSALMTATVLRGVRGIDARAGRLVEIVIAASTLATRDLLDEARTVERTLVAGDLPSARRRVARIVGRDVDELDESGIARATIETLAESTCDGIVAPLVALALGGAPLAMAFKATSTLDSMIGHREPPYTHLGTAAARLDDLFNIIPARLTALVMVVSAPLVGGSARRAFRAVRADARRHRSPNSGFPEAAMAGALGVRLGGASSYDGVRVELPPLHAIGRAPTRRDVSRAMSLCALTSLIVGGAVAAMRRG